MRINLRTYTSQLAFGFISLNTLNALETYHSSIFDSGISVIVEPQIPNQFVATNKRRGILTKSIHADVLLLKCYIS